MRDGTSVDAVRSGFIEQMGLLAQGEGLPPAAGRIFAALVFDGETIAFSNLAVDLKLSRASVSTSMRLLEERGLVRRSRRPGDRQDYFEIAPDAFDAMLASARRRIDSVKREIDATIAALPSSEEGPRQRLSRFSDFYRRVGEALSLSRAGSSTTVDGIDQP